MNCACLLDPQNEEMSSAVRMKERIVVFMGLAIFGAVFLSCRGLDCIMHLYIAAHNFKNITMVAAVYSASKSYAVLLCCVE